MVNTSSSKGGSLNNQSNIKKVETFKQQHQQQQKKTMTNVANCITPKTTSQMKNQVQQPMPSHDAPLQSTCPELVVETQIPTTLVTEMSPVKDDENNQINLEEEISIIKVPKFVRFPFKQKDFSKTEWKMYLNAHMRRLVSPKSPLMVVSELFRDVPIQLREHRKNNNIIGYTALLDIDGCRYAANEVSKTQAKQKACESFLRVMLTQKIREQSVKKEESPMKTGMEDRENGSVSKPIRPSHDDFPWPHYASLAMYNLLQQWELQPSPRAINLQEKQLDAISFPLPTTNAMKKFPDNPAIYNPIQLMNHMRPGIQFIDIVISLTPSVFQVKCVIDKIPFLGQGSTKKEAKKNLCIAAIKHFWKFDYYEDGPRSME